jgi:hypothetical protein
MMSRLEKAPYEYSSTPDLEEILLACLANNGVDKVEGQAVIAVIQGPVIICLAPDEVDPEVKPGTKVVRGLSSEQLLERLGSVGGSLG